LRQPAVRQTDGGGRTFLGEPVEAPPYPGAKLYFLIEDLLDDRDGLSVLIRVTAEELPIPEAEAKKTPAGNRPRSQRLRDLPAEPGPD
jgi:hypothetical protein